jgi:hypothetical protein
MKTPAVTCFALASVWLSAAGAYAPPSAATASVPVEAAPAEAAPAGGKKPVPNFVLVVNCGLLGPNKLGDNLHFTITVNSRTGVFSPDAVGVLEVYDPEERVLTCDLQGRPAAGVMIYEFNLAPKYLEKTRFSFKCTGRDEKGNTTADVVTVHVKDFLPRNFQ